MVGWHLSGGMNYDTDPKVWDLWEVWIGEQKGHEALYNDKSGNLKEIRVYDRIFKRNVLWVATREVK
jgi:hypothetical protein